MAKHLKSKKRFLLSQKQKWKALTMVLSVCVAVGTTVALMLPAITMSDSSCDLTEHTHSIEEGCYSITMEYALTCNYETLGVHRHSPDCYNEDQNELCGYSDKLLHTHDSLCFDDTGVLVCSLPEIKEHRHSDECRVVPQTVLDEGHTHEDTCWEWFTSSEPNCGTEESAGHAHDEVCMDADGNLICEKEETIGHQHDESCFKLIKGELLCTEEEREPVIELGEPELICEREELIPHVHEEWCFLYDEERGEDVLICTETVVQTHQHSEACFAEVETPILICQIPEHIHSDACLETDEDTSEQNPVDEVSPDDIAASPISPQLYTLTYEGENYTITVSYGDEAMLPEDVELSVVEILPETYEYEDYYAQAKQALQNENILYAGVFDIHFIAEGIVVEPAAPVQMSISYAEALPAREDAIAQVVHFGELKTEVISAEVKIDDDGIIEIAHIQEDFSAPQVNTKMRIARSTPEPSITVLALTVDNMDHGPNKLLVDWYVFLDKEWTKVGSTRTGWQGNVGSDGYDYISESQAKYVLAQYGFTGGQDGYNDLAYRMIETYGAEPTLRAGIYDLIDGTDGDGNHYYRLAKDSQTDAYCVYFIPNTAAGVEDKDGTQYTVYEKYGDGIGVYSVRVYDPEYRVYNATETLPIGYVVHGRLISLDVKKIPEKTEADNFGWCLHRPSLMAIGEIGTDTNSNVAEKDDGVCTITLNSVTQAIYITIHDNVHKEDTEILSVPPDELTVNYFIYIDGKWEQVGTTHTGWTISGRRAAGSDTYDDPNYLASGSKPDTFAPDDGGYERDVISMSQVENILGRYGFTPSVKTPFSIEQQGGSAKNETYRIKDLGYQKLKLDEETGKLVPELQTVYFDTYYDGQGSLLFYPLSQSGTKEADGEAQSCAGYNVYYVPHGSSKTSYTDGPNALTSFSTVGRKDVEYYVYLDGSWTKVGTSHYYNPAVSSNDRDTIGIHQIYEFLAPYGFPESGPENSEELFYVDRSGKCKNDTAIANGQYQLATKGSEPTGAYKVYWMPGTTTSQSNAATPVVVADGQFYLFQVYEPSNTVYESMDVCPKVYVRHGQTGELVVKMVNAEEGHGGSGWVVKGLNRGVTLMEGSGPVEITNGDGSVSELKRVLDETTGYWTYTFTNMQQTAIIAFHYSNGDRSLSNNYADAENSESLTGLVTDPNIRFTMHNYSTRINEYLREIGLASFTGGSTGVETEVDSSGDTVYKEQNTNQTYLSFRGAGGNGVTYSPYLDNDPFQKNHATVQRNLNGGYPAIDVTHHGYTTAERLKSVGFSDADIAAWNRANGKSLAFLFGGGGATDSDDDGITEIADGNATYVLNYMNNVNTPLQIINGKYQYFSYFNAADFNTAEQKWYVRNYVERTESTTSYLTKDDYGDFLPFNHSGGELVPNRAYNFYQEDVDYWYGMTMRAKFYMSEGGSTDTGPMIFSFAGDDDVYVFVDGKLVLDVGGTHGSCTGFINFQTGLVAAYYDFNGVTAGQETLIGSGRDGLQTDPYGGESYYRYYSTTIYEAYKAAMKEQGMSDVDIEKTLDEIFIATGETVEDYYGVEYPVYRFRDYSTHDLDYFYMERGSSVANCNIQFNLSTLPTENLTVAKAVNYEIADPTEDDKIFYTTAEKHSFRIIGNEGNAPLTGSIGYTYDVTTADGKPDGTVTADSNGIFQISAGQRITANDINEWLKRDGYDGYIVQELIPKSHVLANTPVDINGQAVEGGDPVTISDVTYIPYNFTAHIGEGDNSVVFTPYTNLRSLTNAGYLVLEKDIGGTDSDVEFSVKVSINNVPVPEGTKFYPLGNNDEILGEQNYVRADANGVVKIKAGTRYRLGAKLIPKYTFTVEEVDIPDGWAFESYTVDGGEPSATAAGTIAQNTTHTVLVKNKSAAINLDVPLTKQFIGMDKGDAKPRTAQFVARQVVLENNQFIFVADPTIPNPTVSITCTGDKANTANIQLAYPEGTPGGVYYYSISETETTVQEGEIFFNDKSVYTVKVVIGSDDDAARTAKITAIYKDGVLISGADGETNIENGPASLAFVNRKGGAILPDTGGTGTFPYIFSGWAMIVVASILIYKTKRKNGRRQDM